jgi:hypothetical protein
MYPKDGTTFDFMLRPPNDESEVVESPLLNVLEPEVVMLFFAYTLSPYKFNSTFGL